MSAETYGGNHPLIPGTLDTDYTQTNYSSTGGQLARGYDAMGARLAFPAFPDSDEQPEGATTTWEFEGDVGTYEGQARLALSINFADTGSSLAVTAQLHVLDVTPGDLSGPLVYDKSGPVLASHGVGVADLGVIDVSSYADPATGFFALITGGTLVSLTPPDPESLTDDQVRTALASWGQSVEYLCRPPRIRWLFPGDPPPPPPTGTGFAPPLRIHPRSDGLGLSSAVRVWPPPPSQQRGGRPAPGSYL